MRAFEYSSCQEVKNLLLPLRQVTSLLSERGIDVFDSISPVFAIQKCDPAPFYLFDEVG